MKLIDLNVNDKNDIEYALIEYVMSIQSILLYKFDADDFSTPYTLNNIRVNAHQKIIDVLSRLNMFKSVDEFALYDRSKLIFDNLDRVWNLTYPNVEFDLKNDDNISTMVALLEEFIFDDKTIEYLVNGDVKIFE